MALNMPPACRVETAFKNVHDGKNLTDIEQKKKKTEI